MQMIRGRAISSNLKNVNSAGHQIGAGNRHECLHRNIKFGELGQTAQAAEEPLKNRLRAA